MLLRLVECTNHETVYGILEVEDVDEKEVQNKIYEIKNKFYEDGFDDWTIENVFEEFPCEWNWTFHEGDYVVEI